MVYVEIYAHAFFQSNFFSAPVLPGMGAYIYKVYNKEIKN